MAVLICNSKCETGSLLLDNFDVGEILFQEDDNAVIERLCSVIEDYDMQANENRRLECYVLLAELSSLWLLRQGNIPDRLSYKADITATTPDDLLAKSLLVKLPGINCPFPALDRIPVSYSSTSTVHLVLFGASQLVEAVATHAALVAHYPNYIRDNSLRTRITIVDSNVNELRNRLMRHCGSLFEHSYYRTLDLYDENPQCITHKPFYEGRRKDFVDVEWEFVCGDEWSDAIRQKLMEWASSDSQQLTLAVCHADDNKNIEAAFSLPEAVYDNRIPILCATKQRGLVNLVGEGGRYVCVYPISYCDGSLQTLRALKRMAKMVNYVYDHCYSLSPTDTVTAPASIQPQEVERAWRSLTSFAKQYSNTCNAMALGSKMHSVGLDASDWQAYYALSRDEINHLSEVEHNRWSVEELMLGYRPVTDDEQALVENDISQKKVLKDRKIHYDLRAYSDLRADDTGKNANTYDMALTQSIPLIIKTCTID